MQPMTNSRSNRVKLTAASSEQATEADTYVSIAFVGPSTEQQTHFVSIVFHCLPLQLITHSHPVYETHTLKYD